MMRMVDKMVIALLKAVLIPQFKSGSYNSLRGFNPIILLLCLMITKRENFHLSLFVIGKLRIEKKQITVSSA